MMFLGSRFCPHCGERAGQVTDTGRTTRQCPRCTHVLHAVDVSGTPLEQCTGCGGFWVAIEAFDHVCSNREAQAAATGLKLPAPKPAAPSVRYVKCPGCGKLMNRINYAGGSGIIVDICRDHGIWLDRDELRHVVEFIQAGGVDKVRKREIEKLQLERSALERQRAMSPGTLTSTPNDTSDDTSVFVWIDLIGEIIRWIRK